MVIKFELWNMDLGVFIEFQVRYFENNLQAIYGLKGSRNIRVV